MQGGNLLNCLKILFNHLVQNFWLLRPNSYAILLKSNFVKFIQGKQICGSDIIVCGFILKGYKPKLIISMSCKLNPEISN